MSQPSLLRRRDYLSLLTNASLVSILPASLARSSAAERHATTEDTNGIGSEPKGSRTGLYVQDGKFCRQGRPIKALGVNYFDSFSQWLTEDPVRFEQAIARCEQGFSELHDLKIPFLRFNAGGFYPTNWQLYLASPEIYLERWDRFVGLAERYELGLIPSLFWTFFTQPGIAGEPLLAWGKPESRTHANMKAYVDAIVGRSKHSHAIWAWEFGNEYNLEVDLPNPQHHLKHWYQTSLGMPASPGEQDFLTTEHMGVALQAFGEAVRKHDSHRPVLAGNASPRSAAWNLSEHQSWKADSEEEWLIALAQQNPEPLDALSMHLYPFHQDGSGRAGDPGLGTLESASKLAARTNKPLWVGEFGNAPAASPDERFAQYQSMIDWLESTKVGLAAAWVYDFQPQPVNNLAAPENRSLLELIAETNKKWRKGEEEV